MKILIADDNKRVRELLKRLLLSSIQHVEFVESTNGEETVECYLREKPDLVLMDIVMDRLDGLKATRKILSLEKTAKIIIVSQLPEDEYRQEAIEVGALEFINKENLSALTEVVNRLFEKNISENLN